MQQPEIISLWQVSYAYDQGGNTRFSYPGAELPALSRVSLSVREGEWIALLGSNGSGKTTLAKHLNALLLPTQGACFICGLDTADERNKWKIRSAVSMVFQNPENQIVTTVLEEDVAFGPENLGLPPEEIRRRVEVALSICGLSDKAKSAVTTLSGGQKQRLAIAGAIAMGARVIVLDEPTAMLDPEGRSEIRALLHDLRDRGVTIVLVTHLLEEVLDVDRVFVLSLGRVEWQGTPDELFSRKNLNPDWGLEVPPMLRLKDRLVAGGKIPPDTPPTAEGITKALCS